VPSCRLTAVVRPATRAGRRTGGFVADLSPLEGEARASAIGECSTAWSRDLPHEPEGRTSMATEARDVERIYSTHEVVAKLRRLADALEQNKPFRIQVAGERIRVPARAQFSVEHERDDDEEEIEFQLKWSLADVPSEDDDDDEPVVDL
jgi:amphi-Trp domain-containing protein